MRPSRYMRALLMSPSRFIRALLQCAPLVIYRLLRCASLVIILPERWARMFNRPFFYERVRTVMSRRALAVNPSCGWVAPEVPPWEVFRPELRLLFLMRTFGNSSWMTERSSCPFKQFSKGWPHSSAWAWPVAFLVRIYWFAGVFLV